MKRIVLVLLFAIFCFCDAGISRGVRPRESRFLTMAPGSTVGDSTVRLEIAKLKKTISRQELKIKSLLSKLAVLNNENRFLKSYFKKHNIPLPQSEMSNRCYYGGKLRNNKWVDSAF